MVFEIKINNKRIKTEKGKTILEVAKEHGIKIPTFCFHSDLEAQGGCRICLVEIKGRKDLATTCNTIVEPGMEISTDSEKVKKARKINLELIFAQHIEECHDCVWGFNCQLLDLAREYGVEITRFTDRKKGFPVYQFGPSLLFDSSKCINCNNCVEICKKQKVNFLETELRNGFYEVIPSKNPKRDCIYCGQCLMHCPVGAFEAVGEFEDVKKPLMEKDKVVVVHFAPSIRTSIGEEFGLEPGTVVTGKLVAALRKLGFYKVFDTSVGADFTTTEEAKEIIEKLRKNETPCLSSCCPSWVKFVEFNYPQFIPFIATTRSPQAILGGLIKTYWAKKHKIDPARIVVVSIMPCTAKKYEIKRKQLRVGKLFPIDYVLTTRELAFLLKKEKIDFVNLKPQKADDPLGIPSGGGVIYGASGGVAESAMRTANNLMTGSTKTEFKELRGEKGIKKVLMKVGGRKIKMAVVSGTGNAVKILEELKKNIKAYDAVEVMACPGGCIGGGGQPLPSNEEIRKKRAASLYDIDKKTEVRLANENPVVKKVYKEFLTNEKIIHKICHTSYSKKSKEVKFK